MTLNTELLDKTLEYVRTNPEDWDQEEWVLLTSCGTYGCFAYHAVRLANPQLVKGAQPGGVLPAAGGRSVKDVATELLGLTWDLEDAAVELTEPTADRRQRTRCSCCPDGPPAVRAKPLFNGLNTLEGVEAAALALKKAAADRGELA